MSKITTSIAIATFLLFPGILPAQGFDDLNNEAFKERDNKNYNRAIELCTQSISVKTNARAYIIRGDSRYYRGDYEAAIDDFTSALRYYSEYYSDNKEKAAIYYLRGLCEKDLNRYTDAISDFGYALDYSYSLPGYVYWNRASCYYKSGKYKESDDDYGKAIDRISDTKDLSSLHKARGDCQAALWDYEKANTLYTRAINYDPGNYYAWWQRGYYQDVDGKDDEALADYTKAIEIILASNNPSSNTDLATLYRNQAVLQENKKRYDEALTAINKAIQANPNFIKAYQSRASIYKDLKKYDKAKADYSSAISLQKDNKAKSGIYLTRSVMEMNILDYTSALDDLEKAVGLAPDDGMNHWHKAMVHGYKRNYAIAIKECDSALDLYRKDSSSTASLIFLRAGFRDNAGDYQGAADDYRLYLQYYPGSYAGYYELGRLFKRKMKNNDLADANLSKAAELAEQKKDTSKLCYIKAIQGDKEGAIGKMKLILANTNAGKTYEYKWSLHNMACIYALTGNVTKALEFVDKSLQAGFDDFNHLLTDRDLVSLMSLPQWKIMLAKYKAPASR